MARIRQYQPQVSPRGRMPGQATPATFGAPIGQAVAQAGQALGTMAEALRERQVRREQLENERILSEQRLELSEWMDEAQRAAPPGAPGFVESFLEQFGEREQALGELERTGPGREHLQQGMLRLRERMAQNAMQFQAEASARYEVQQVEETVQNSVNAVRADPALIDTVLEDVDRLSRELPLDAQAQERFRQENRPNVGFSSIMGRLDTVEAPIEAQAIERELLETDRWKELLTNQQYASALDRARRLRDQLGRQQQQEYVQGFQEQLRQWETGRNLDTRRFSEEEIREMVPDPALAEQMAFQAQHSKRVGAQSQWIRTAAPEDIAQYLGRLEGAMGEEIERLGEFDEASREMQAFQTAMEQHGRALREDPARYIIGNEDRFRQLYLEFATAETGEDSERALESYVSAMSAEQTRLGIAPHHVKLLPADYVAEVAQRLELVEQTPEGAQRYYEQIRATQEQFGDHWPVVHRQLEDAGVLSGPASVAAQLTSSSDQRVAINLLRATAIGERQLHEGIGEAGFKGALQQAVDGQLDGLWSSAIPQAGGAQAYGRFRESVELLASYYYSRGEEGSISAAARRAANELVNSKYDFVGTYRIPVDATSSAWSVSRGARIMLDRLEDFDHVMPQSAFGLRDEDIREQYLNSLQGDAYWVTNADESGLQLQRPDGAVAMQWVDGAERPIELTWEELAAISTSRPRPEGERPPVTGGMGGRPPRPGVER